MQRIHIIAISLIIILSSVHFVISQLEFEENGLFVNLSLITSIAITISILVIIIRKYTGTKGIRRSYLYLLLAYIAYIQGEIAWFALETVLGLEPYPSIADIGFFFYFVFTAVFLIAAVRGFERPITRYDIGHTILLISIIVSVYLVLAIEAETAPFDLFYTLPFILGAATTFTLALMAVNKLRYSSYRLAWLIIFISIAISTTADIWYYILETVSVYTYDHVINTLWITSDAVLVYALLQHRRSLD